ncbi:MAG: ATP-binding protein [Chitinivorax sp.]
MSRLFNDWMLFMPEANENSALNSAASDENVSLQRAFQTFIEASQHLEQAYEELQQKVQGLTDELAVANGELRRQYAEKALLSQRLQILLESLPAGVVEVAADGCVADLNSTGVAMLGETVQGCLWRDVRRERFAATFNPEEWLLRGEGESRVVNLAERPLPDGSGSIVLVHDVTAAHRLQQQLEHHKRLSAMGEMSAVLAHQLRTPLSAALLYVANLQRPSLRPDDVVRFADKALGRLRHLEKLVQDMLRFVRGQGSGQLESVSVGDLLADACASVESELLKSGVSLRQKDVSGVASCLLRADRQALQSALVALLENAIQASPADGVIELELSPAEQGVALSVRDHGQGIDPQLSSRLFEPFFTTRSHGTGLGLAIVRNVVEGIGGRVSAGNADGGGAEFILVLPVSASHSIVS